MQFLIPTPLPLSAFTMTEIPGSIFLILLSVLSAVLLAIYAAKEFQGDMKKTIPAFAGITLMISIALISFFGLSATSVRGMILCLILTFCSYSDIRTRECANYPHLMIAVAAFIGTELSAVPDMLLGALMVFVIQFFGAWVTKSELNGADLKLSTACAFLLGAARGITGLVIGMGLGILVNRFRSRDTKAGFPLIPYLAVGFLTALFL